MPRASRNSPTHAVPAARTEQPFARLATQVAPLSVWDQASGRRCVLLTTHVHWAFRVVRLPDMLIAVARKIRAAKRVFVLAAELPLMVLGTS